MLLVAPVGVASGWHGQAESANLLDVLKVDIRGIILCTASRALQMEREQQEINSKTRSGYHLGLRSSFGNVGVDLNSVLLRACAS